MEKSIRLFTLYAKEDEGLVEELTIHLSRLRRKGVITDYSDKEISRTEYWDEETRLDFESCDYMLFILSPALLMSGYMEDDEIQMAIRAGEQGLLSIVPIFVRNCDLTNDPLEKFSSLPVNGQPIESYLWVDRQNAWRAVTDGLTALIEGQDPFAETATPMTEAPPEIIGLAQQKKDLPRYAQWAIALLALSAMAMMSFYILNYKVADAVTAVVKPNGNMGAQTVAFVPQDLPDWDEPDEEELIVEENPAPRPKKIYQSTKLQLATPKAEKELVTIIADTVKAKEAEVPPAPPKRPSVNSAQMEQMLFDFSQGKIAVAEFGNYLCNALYTQVIFDNSPMSFQQMCDEIKGIKTKRIKKFTVLSASFDNGCIRSMNVELKRKGLLNL